MTGLGFALFGLAVCWWHPFGPLVALVGAVLTFAGWLGGDRSRDRLRALSPVARQLTRHGSDDPDLPPLVRHGGPGRDRRLAAGAFLVALIFMHLIRSPARMWLAAGVGLFWLGILLTLTMSDYFTRSHAAY